MTLVLSQAFHLVSVRTRRVSIFQHNLNIITIYAWLIEVRSPPASAMTSGCAANCLMTQVALVVIFVYVPGVQFVMGTAPPPPIAAYVPPVIFGVIITVYNELNQLYAKYHPKSWLARALKW